MPIHNDLPFSEVDEGYCFPVHKFVLAHEAACWMSTLKSCILHIWCDVLPDKKFVAESFPIRNRTQTRHFKGESDTYEQSVRCTVGFCQTWEMERVLCSPITSTSVIWQQLCLIFVCRGNECCIWWNVGHLPWTLVMNTNVSAAALFCLNLASGEEIFNLHPS